MKKLTVSQWFAGFVVAAVTFVVAFNLSAPAQDDKKGGEKPKYARGLVLPKNLAFQIAQSWARHGHRLKALPTVTASSYDCRTLGLVPPIKNQSDCGSCWDFSGTGACEAALFKAGQAKADGSFGLSEQFTLDCGRNGGCNGDWAETVLEWCKSKGLPTVADYGSYSARPGQCKSTGSMKMWRIVDYGYVGTDSTVPSVQSMKNAMVQFGPLSVAVAADDSLANYSSGVFKGSGSRDIDHAVMIVGWQDDASITSGGYWIMRNSWGTSWGEQGYMKIAYGANMIGYGALWASAQAAPPPPVPPGPTPPVPPGPFPPIPGDSITFGADVKAGTYQLIDVSKYEAAPRGTMDALRLLKQLFDGIPLKGIPEVIQKKEGAQRGGNDCGCSFGGICRCGALPFGCKCDGVLPLRKAG
jgi:hypothetical protein